MDNQFEFGMVGLGVMGRNFALHMADKGYSVAGLDTDTAKVADFIKLGSGKPVAGFSDLDAFVKALKTPKNILLLVPAGAVVDSVITSLKPYLEAGDLVADLGNSFFKDTDRRIDELNAIDISFMGIGVSGGEKGARLGASIMPGGSPEAYERLARMLTDISAKTTNNEACSAFMGSGSAGHFVKMVHNGIEYGLMQLIAEAYQILKVVLNKSNAEMQTIFSTWNQGRLQSYLIQITADIFAQKDESGQGDLLNQIKDVARQKGTGSWTSQEALSEGLPLSTINAAVDFRNISAQQNLRSAMAKVYSQQAAAITNPYNISVDNVEKALYNAFVITYAQGLSMLSQAGSQYEFAITVTDVAKVWRAGCIIRAALLNNIVACYQSYPKAESILLHTPFSNTWLQEQSSVRLVGKTALENKLPAPSLINSISYMDGLSTSTLPTNLIQAQRDYFGAHGYEKNNAAGTFHTQWELDNDDVTVH